MHITNFSKQAVRFGMTVTGVQRSSQSSIHFKIETEIKTDILDSYSLLDSDRTLLRKSMGNVLGVVQGSRGSSVEH